MRRVPGSNPEIRTRGDVELSCVYTGAMRLPSKLPEAIERLTEAVSTQRLRLAAAALTDRYKTATQAAAIRGEDERLAYLLVRMPATYAALVQAMRAAKRQFMPRSDNDSMSDNGVVMETMLDLGSGPGTAAWAAVELFPDVR